MLGLICVAMHFPIWYYILKTSTLNSLQLLVGEGINYGIGVIQTSNTRLFFKGELFFLLQNYYRNEGKMKKKNNSTHSNTFTYQEADVGWHLVYFVVVPFASVGY